MKVTLTETGGWTNIRTGCTVETDSLPSDEARLLEAALQQADLFAVHGNAPNARDARCVTIEFVHGGRHERTSFSEAAAPAGARVLLDILRPRSRPIPAS